MRCALSKTLFVAALFLTWAFGQDGRAPELKTDDLGYNLRVLEWKQTDSSHTVVLGAATIGTRADGLRLLVLSTDRAETPLELDKFSEGELKLSPHLEVINSNSAYLHFYAPYGFYRGSIKYVFDLSSGKVPTKIRYGFLALTSVSHVNGTLVYSASFGQEGDVQKGWQGRHMAIVLKPRADDLPAYDVVEDGTTQPRLATPLTLHGPNGEEVVVENTTPPGQPHRPSTILVGSNATNTAYPAPIPTLDFYRQALPQRQPPGEIESDIGPFVQGGDRIWFATTFYDGEGVSGVGAIGAFNLSTRKYEMHYPREIALWSGSTILLDGSDLWIGLKRRPEGADLGGGLLRYNIATGAAKIYTLPDMIFTIDRVGDALYCGTSRGLYLKRGDAITQLRFEPDEGGRVVMVAHATSRLRPPSTAR